MMPLSTTPFLLPLTKKQRGQLSKNCYSKTRLEKWVRLRMQKIATPRLSKLNINDAVTMLMNDVLSRPATWIGIPSDKTRQEVSKIQVNIEGIAESLMKYSSKRDHFYDYNNLVVKVLRENTYQDSLLFDSGGCTIEVTPNDTVSTVGVSFDAFPTLQCIINGLPQW